MKKLSFLLICVLLFSCTSNKNNPEENSNNDYSFINVWDVKPTFIFDDIEVDFYIFDYDQHTKKKEHIVNITQAYDSFEKGGLFVYKNSYFGIIDGNGQIKIPINNEQYVKIGEKDKKILAFSNEHLKFGSDSIENQYYILDNYSITPTTEIICYGTGPDQHYSVNKNLDIKYFYINDDDIGYQDVDFSYIKEPYLIRSYICNQCGLSEEQGYIEGFIVIDGGLLNILDIDKKHKPIIFSDGVILFRDENSGKVIYVDQTGNHIGSEYEDGRGFFESLAPVKKDNKWGYIDKKGNVVVDFVFDKATTICEGKAWVIYEGRTGRINIIDMINNNIPFNDEVLSTNNYEIIDYKDMFEDIKICSELDYIMIKADSINIRSAPSVDSDKKGRIYKFDICPYYEKIEKDDYIWLRIDDDKWIADNEEWVKYLNSP